MVGRKGTHDIDWLAAYIVGGLEIGQDDVVLDLCCGNGLVTVRVAARAKSVVGVDFSQLLLQQAGAISSAPNVTYVEGDARNLSASIGNQVFDKAYISAAFQYFDRATGRDVLIGLRNAVRPGGKVAVLDIPDQGRKLVHHIRALGRLLAPSFAGDGHRSNNRFYSFAARIGYLTRNVAHAVGLKQGSSELGWWWRRAEFAALANASGFDCLTVDQPEQNPHHHYRFDAIMRRRS
jgi:SAM-dependent methyltransferase